MAATVPPRALPLTTKMGMWPQEARSSPTNSVPLIPGICASIRMASGEKPGRQRPVRRPRSTSQSLAPFAVHRIAGHVSSVAVTSRLTRSSSINRTTGRSHWRVQHAI